MVDLTNQSTFHVFLMVWDVLRTLVMSAPIENTFFLAETSL